MSLIEKAAIKIGNSSKLHLKINEEDEQIIIYGAINLLQTIFSILWVVIFGGLFGVICEALVFTFTVRILRKYSGGGHASSSICCVIIGTISAVIAGILIDKIFYKFSIASILLISIVIMIIAFIIVTKNAPVDSINKPISNIEMKKQLKRKSIIVLEVISIIILILIILSNKYYQLSCIKIIQSIILGILWQITTLTKSGISVLNKVDFILGSIIVKFCRI